MRDKYDREINYLRISVTDLCNLRCKYCMPEDGIDKKCHEDILRDEDILKIVEQASSLGINKIRITGGEPLVRKGIVELIEKINNIDGIDEVVLTTNGTLLKDKIFALEKAGLKRINLSLDTMDANKYRAITKHGNLQDVLDSIKLIMQTKMKPLKINTVLMKGFNDDEVIDFINLTKDNEITVRFIELMPIGNSSINWKDNYLSGDDIINKVPDLIRVLGKKSETATYYQLPNALGKVGIINPISHSFCSSCNRIRLTADGKFKPCLHSDLEIDIKEYLGMSDNIIKSVIKGVIFDKPRAHRITSEDYVPVKRNMNRIGG